MCVCSVSKSILEKFARMTVYQRAMLAKDGHQAEVQHMEGCKCCKEEIAYIQIMDKPISSWPSDLKKYAQPIFCTMRNRPGGLDKSILKVLVAVHVRRESVAAIAEPFMRNHGIALPR